MNRWDEIQGLARDIASNIHVDPVKRDDLPHVKYPVFELMRSDRVVAPPRSCRTMIKGARGKRPSWRLKLAYADEWDAQREATRSSCDAYECGNCGFWHVGSTKALPL